MAGEREFDVVLFGATGFVGKLTAEYLARAAGDARIALAGRSQEKLERVHAVLGESAASWPLIAIDAADAEGVSELAGRASTIATTVGPYRKYGMTLVEGRDPLRGPDRRAAVHARRDRRLRRSRERQRRAHRAQLWL
jgi:short subunit dehydrogenase-like uncharacterized protein